MSRRVIISGIGLITPIGLSVSENWAALMAGRSGITAITRFDTTKSVLKLPVKLRDLILLRTLKKRN